VGGKTNYIALFRYSADKQGIPAFQSTVPKAANVIKLTKSKFYSSVLAEKNTLHQDWTIRKDHGIEFHGLA
jgi:hypothetical protein